LLGDRWTPSRCFAHRRSYVLTRWTQHSESANDCNSDLLGDCWTPSRCFAHRRSYNQGYNQMDLSFCWNMLHVRSTQRKRTKRVQSLLPHVHTCSMFQQTDKVRTSTCRVLYQVTGTNCAKHAATHTHTHTHTRTHTRTHTHAHTHTRTHTRAARSRQYDEVHTSQL